jgi:hypothetical protein
MFYNIVPSMPVLKKTLMMKMFQPWRLPQEKMTIMAAVPRE